MSLADELQKLADLYDDGVLTEQEFAEAKRLLLKPPLPAPPERADSSLGSAADRYVDFQIIMGVIGVIIAFIMIAAFLSHMK